MCFSLGKTRKKNQQQPKSPKLWVEVRKSVNESSWMITVQIGSGGQEVLESRPWGGGKNSIEHLLGWKFGAN